MGENLAGGKKAADCPGFLYFEGSTGLRTQQTQQNLTGLPKQTTPAVTSVPNGSHFHLWTDSIGILKQKLLLPSKNISYHILPFHCPRLSSKLPYAFGAFTHSNSSLPALSLSILCLWDRPNARRVRHGDPRVHCRNLVWIIQREQFSVPASPGCPCHLQSCPASWLGPTGTAQAQPML